MVVYLLFSFILIQAPDAQAQSAPTTFKSSVSKNEITWAFDKAYPVGQFINGDFFVVGPVTIISISPGWDGTKHGTVVDPIVAPQQGYTSLGPGFSDSLRLKTFPARIDGVHSVVSTIGLDARVKGGAAEALRRAAVLTVLTAAPPADAFRPPYVAGSKPIHRSSQVRWEKLPKLAPPSSVELPSTTTLQEVWLDHYSFKGNDNSSIHPNENMPPYPRDLAIVANTHSLMTMLDIPERTSMTYRLIQLGIDLYSVHLENQDAWRAYGGFGAGRKWPIIYASILLDQASMRSLIYEANSSPSRTGVVNKFGEDGHTYYGAGGVARYGQDCVDGMYDRYLTTGSGDKDCRDPNGLVDGPGYLHCCNGPAFAGSGLSGRLMQAESLWGHNAFFDFVDRWIAMEGDRTTGSNPFGHPFIQAMWIKYRNSIPSPPPSPTRLNPPARPRVFSH